MDLSFQPPIIVLANGRFPTHTVPLNILDKAGTVICTDGSADTLLKLGREPHVIMGDFDSTELDRNSFRGLWIPAPDQDKTDLHKTLDWCLVNNLSKITVLGATGEREDHTLGNLHLFVQFSDQMDIQFITDYSTILCIRGKHIFSSHPGQIISIVAVHHVDRIVTHGLKYPLAKNSFPPGCNGISNEAVGTQFSINTTDPVWLFINHMK